MRRPRALFCAASVVVVLAVGGCGSRTEGVVSEEPVASPYDGPMQVEIDYDHPNPYRSGGAAALALECEHGPSKGGAGNYDSGPESVQPTANEALDNFLAEEGWLLQLPDSGYRIERDDGDRVLFSYDQDDRTRIALIAADGIGNGRDETGWGIESYAQCDPSELPAEATDALGIGVWEDAAGDRQPTGEIVSYQGAEHCDWQRVTFLAMDDEKRQYIRDIDGQFLDMKVIEQAYAADPELPADAEDTGFRQDRRHLWLARDGSAAYVGDATQVERWPLATEPFGCM